MGIEPRSPVYSGIKVNYHYGGFTSVKSKGAKKSTDLVEIWHNSCFHESEGFFHLYQNFHFLDIYVQTFFGFKMDQTSEDSKNV